MLAPTSAFAAHLGGGIVQVFVTHPDMDSVVAHEVVSSDSLSGTYYETGNNRFTGRDTFIYGFTPGRTIYMKVRAIGADNEASDWVQVRLGSASRERIVMRCTGVQGSIIADGSLFCCTKDNRIFGVRNDGQINF